MQMAPQYWIGNADGFTRPAAPAYLEGFLDLLLGALADPDAAQLVDLTGVLDKIERALPSEAKLETRQPMVALYVLWHAFLDPQHHRPKAAEVIQKYKADLEAPGVLAFVVCVVTSAGIEWSADQLVDLVEARRDDLHRGRGQPLPTRLDTALLLCAAERSWDAQNVTQALSLISEAVASLPGNAALIAFEQDAQAGNKPPIALLDFVLAKNSWQPNDGVATKPEVSDAEETGPENETPDLS
jgi:hypothetical protein